MSRAYRISVRESLSRHVQVEDGVSSSLELLPILAPERMAALLAAELSARGFVREGDVARRAAEGGVQVEISLDRGEVTVTAQGHQQLELEDHRSGEVEDQGRSEAKREQLQRQAQEAMERAASVAVETLRTHVTDQLEAHLKSLREELDQAVNRVTAEALKQRAAELGEVQEIHEEANGSLTIKVKV